MVLAMLILRSLNLVIEKIIAGSEVDGELTRTAILRAIAMHGPIARTTIATFVSVSSATVTSVTRNLIDAGLVAMTSKARTTGRGRPSELLEIVPAAVSLVGVKVMEDHLTGVVADLRGDVLDEFELPFDPHVDDPASGIATRLDSAVDLEADRVLGVGLGVPGMVDTNAGGRVTSPMFGWQDLRLGDRVRDLTGLPVIVDNDVNTLTVAERLYGRARSGVNDFLTVTLGRGVGLGISLNRSVYRGPHGGAGELGHTHAVDGGRRCDCGRRGCLETIVGEPGLLAAARDAGIIDHTDGIEVLRDAGSAAGPAADLFHDAGAHLGRSLADLVNLLAPELVIISGEGVTSWPLMEAGFQDAFNAGLLGVHRQVQVVVDEWHDRNWARGAASLVLRSVYTLTPDVGDPENEIRSRLQAVGSGARA